MPPLTEPVVLQPLIMPNDPGVDGLHRTNLKRETFARIQDAISVPSLIETQLNSFEWFRREGLRELFDEISPITDFTGKNMELRFLDYAFGEPRYDEYECRERDMTYAAPLRVNVQLHILSTGELKESEIFLGDFPLMTENGTFVINGAERVVVSQLIRSPGVYFKEEKDPTSGRGLHSAKLIPNRGAWLEFETNKRDVISVKVDRKRKIMERGLPDRQLGGSLLLRDLPELPVVQQHERDVHPVLHDRGQLGQVLAEAAVARHREDLAARALVPHRGPRAHRRR